MTARLRGLLLASLLLAQSCATTSVESRVTDPTEVAEARANDQAAGTRSATVLVVILRLKVGVDGAVRDAQVAQSAGNDKFDQAAVKAAYNLHFNPAHNHDGQPIESTIRFAFQFPVEN